MILLGLFTVVAVAIIVFRIVAFVITGIAAMALLIGSAVLGVSVIGILGGAAAVLVSAAHSLPS